MAKIKSKKFEGVYYNELKNGDRSYYIVYRIDAKKPPVWEKIGLHSQGIREAYCSQKRNDRINHVRHGEVPPEVAKRRKKSVVTLNDLFDEMMEHKSIAKSTAINYKSRWRVWVREVLGKEDAYAITPRQIISERNKWDTGERTKLEVGALIGRVYRYAALHIDGHASLKNPVEEVRAKDSANNSKEIKRLRNNTRDRYLDLDDIELLRDAVKDDFMDALAVDLLLSTGARINTAMSIRKKDVRLKDGTIRLIDHKNGGEVYTGFISDALRPALEKRMGELKGEEKLLGDMSYSKFQRRFKKILDPLFNDGLDSKDASNRVVIHTFRHTFASHLAINGTPIIVIQRLMNHKDISMTMRYAKLAPDSGKESVQNLFRRS